MSTQSLALSVPTPGFERLKERDDQAQHSVEEELLEVVVTAVPPEDGLPAGITDVTQSLKNLTKATFGQQPGPNSRTT